MRNSGLSCRVFGKSKCGEDEGQEVDLGGQRVTSPLMFLVHPQALVRGGGTTDTTEKGN